MKKEVSAEVGFEKLKGEIAVKTAVALKDHKSRVQEVLEVPKADNVQKGKIAEAGEKARFRVLENALAGLENHQYIQKVGEMFNRSGTAEALLNAGQVHKNSEVVGLVIEGNGHMDDIAFDLAKQMGFEAKSYWNGRNYPTKTSQLDPNIAAIQILQEEGKLLLDGKRAATSASAIFVRNKDLFGNLGISAQAALAELNARAAKADEFGVRQP